MTYFKFNSTAHNSVEKVFSSMINEGISLLVDGDARFFVNDNKGNSVAVTVVDTDTHEEIHNFPPIYEWRLKVLGR